MSKPLSLFHRNINDDANDSSNNQKHYQQATHLPSRRFLFGKEAFQLRRSLALVGIRKPGEYKVMRWISQRDNETQEQVNELTSK